MLHSLASGIGNATKKRGETTVSQPCSEKATPGSTRGTGEGGAAEGGGPAAHAESAVTAAAIALAVRRA